MQIAESSDRKRQQKCMMLISNARINKNNNNNDEIRSNLRFESTQNNIFFEDLFQIPNKFMLYKFTVEFLKSDGVFLF